MSTLGEKVWALFPKCPGNRDVLDLISLLGRMIEDLRAGRINEGRVEAFLKRICPKLGVIFVSCGSPMPPDKCVDTLTDIVFGEAFTRNLGKLYEAYVLRAVGEEETESSGLKKKEIL